MIKREISQEIKPIMWGELGAIKMRRGPLRQEILIQPGGETKIDSE